MNPYLLQIVAAERGNSMRAAAAADRLARQARRTSQASPHHVTGLLRAIPHQREAEESVTRRAA